jgi:C-terminal processing protease CtpA/Prc
MKLPLPVRFAILVLGTAVAVADARPRKPETSEGTPVRMQPLVVRARPFSSFGLALEIIANPQTRQIIRMFIKEVTVDSEADSKGLTEGTEILSVDGKSVWSFVLRFKPENELFRLFINRKRGDRITLVVVSPSATTPRTVVLTQGLRTTGSFPWQVWEFP